MLNTQYKNLQKGKKTKPMPPSPLKKVKTVTKEYKIINN
jgi:hypothetical protein